ncbi:MAG: RNA-binding protein [Pseudomonadota bacterium]
MARGGRKHEGVGTVRRCIATGAERPKAQLVRFVIGPDRQLVPDIAGKLPGRGIWVSADRTALERAAKKRLFAKAARSEVRVPDGLADLVEDQLARRVTDLVSLARKAGGAVAGYEKAKTWVDEGRAAALLQAGDGSERGRTKIRLPAEEGPTIDCLTAGELGLSFGRERVIHAALGRGGLTGRVVEDAIRLAGLRAKNGAAAPERTKGSHERQ